MSNLSKAADDIKSIAAKFKGFLEVADALDKVGSIEQAERDAIIAKDKAYKAAEEGKFVLSEINKDIASAEAAYHQAEENAEKVAEAAKARAVSIVTEANQTAAKIINDAEYKKTQFDKLVAEANNNLNLIKSDILSKSEEYSAIVDKIKEVKAKLTAFVG